MHELLAHCPVVIEIPVSWGEMDSFQRLNNIAYLGYFESVRIAYFERLKLMEFINQTDIGPILPPVQCKLKIPLTYPDTVSVGTRISKIEHARFVIRAYHNRQIELYNERLKRWEGVTLFDLALTVPSQFEQAVQFTHAKDAWCALVSVGSKSVCSKRSKSWGSWSPMIWQRIEI